MGGPNEGQEPKATDQETIETTAEPVAEAVTGDAVPAEPAVAEA